MATPNEIEETLAILRNVWNEFPQLRLTQLLSNAAVSNGWNQLDLFYVEDEIMRTALKKFVRESKEREKNNQRT